MQKIKSHFQMRRRKYLFLFVIYNHILTTKIIKLVSYSYKVKLLRFKKKKNITFGRNYEIHALKM